ncbi:MAG: EF-Tu/IF-2/RF-3 family GTPase, partial [Pseudomonadota bacterium]
PTPATWPIGMGRSFLGCYDLFRDRLALIAKSRAGALPEAGEVCHGLDDAKLATLLPAEALATLREEAAMAHGASKPFDLRAYREGHLTPVFFGSAVNTFGVRELLEGLASIAPSPRPQPAVERAVEPAETKVSGFVFKIQANMDPKHRDRTAFVRLASGRFRRGMKLHHVRSDKQITVHNPLMFLAQDRERVDDAWPGDIIGIPNYGSLRIGDTLTEGEVLHFTGIPSFAPELLQKARPEDPLKAKHLDRALRQLAEEGAARVFKPAFGVDWIVGVVGPLQFEILADRVRTEYEIAVRFEPTDLLTARWVRAPDAATLKRFGDANRTSMAEDHDGESVFLARNAWHLDRAAQDWPEIAFLKTRDQAS